MIIETFDQVMATGNGDDEDLTWEMEARGTPFFCPSCYTWQPMDHSCSVEKLEAMDKKEVGVDAIDVCCVTATGTPLYLDLKTKNELVGDPTFTAKIDQTDPTYVTIRLALTRDRTCAVVANGKFVVLSVADVGDPSPSTIYPVRDPSGKLLYKDLNPLPSPFDKFLREEHREARTIYTQFPCDDEDNDGPPPLEECS